MRRPYKKGYKNLHWPSASAYSKRHHNITLFLRCEKTGTSFML